MLLVPRVSLEYPDGDREEEWSTNDLRRIAWGKIVVLRNQSPFPDSPLVYNLKGEKVRKLHFYAKVGAMSFLRFLMFATEVVYSF